MGLLDKARNDWKSITSNTAQWGVEMLLTAPDGQTASIIGMHSKHHMSVDQEGLPVNSKNAHISFSESLVLEANPLYVLRNAKGEVSLARHRVLVKNSTGIDKQYVIERWHQDETLGVIVCILGNYA